MRIKHWAGYGCVNAKRINDGAAKLHVRVEGNHEFGLTRPKWDNYTVYNWLVKRFDKEVPAYEEWSQNRPLIDFKEDFRMDPKSPVSYVEIVDYYFYY